MWYVEIISVFIHEGTTQIEYWNPYVEAFMLEGQSLTLTMEDIYFLTALSRRGEPVNLRTFPPRPHNIEYYIGMYCEASTKKVGFQVLIHKITSLNIWIVLYMIGCITISMCIYALRSLVSRCHHVLLEHYNSHIYEKTIN
jgi:hypothetical protein